ncbi:MAG: alpha/beta hydrolase, partial [Kangiellaceae bacterium]|nr:alpha/beta hydrolase [Kangiellaceae bacterium]
MTENLLPHIEIETSDNPVASVIWLHGLGADGNDFAPIVPELQLPSDLPVRFVFPHAPSISVTINNGFVMPAWYDILDMNIDRKVDETQLRASADQLDKFIENEMSRGIDSSKIIIAGFSQGGAVALEAALRQSNKLAGLLAMSTYFA